jgi:hypothetical protein
MSKKEIKAAIAEYGYKIIKPSWHADEGDKCVVFVAYDEYGICSQFFVDYDIPIAANFIFESVFRNESAVVLRKAIRICLECIGVGG